uniref:TFIIS-type domain-containing protein n=1 Tax=viral metagenome TaxID=1070528 RepID=A0A6C0KPQ6_9ZZZZ
MDLRKSARVALHKYIASEKNISIIEKAIFEYNLENIDYTDILYEVLYLLKDGQKQAEILKTLKCKKMGWNNPEFNDVAFKQKEQDDFTISPFQVEEGVLKCPKCGGCKSFSYSKQTRSADEPMTTFATCVTCKNKWTYSG